MRCKCSFYIIFHLLYMFLGVIYGTLDTSFVYFYKNHFVLVVATDAPFALSFDFGLNGDSW